MTESNADSDSKNTEDVNGKQVTAYVGNLASIRPGRVIVFEISSDMIMKQTKRCITIENNTNDDILLKVKTTTPSGYRVNPGLGLIDAQGSLQCCITLLPHNQYRAMEDKFLVMISRNMQNIKANKKLAMERFWKKMEKRRHELQNSPDYMERLLSVDVNTDEVAENAVDDVTAAAQEQEKLLEKQRKQDEERKLGIRDPSELIPLPLRPSLKQLVEKIKEPKDPNRFDDIEDIMTDLKQKELLLRGRVKLIRCCQWSIVVVICILCALVVVVGYQLPVAYPPTDPNKSPAATSNSFSPNQSAPVLLP